MKSIKPLAAGPKMRVRVGLLESVPDLEDFQKKRRGAEAGGERGESKTDRHREVE